jgi:hypothetical protein
VADIYEYAATVAEDAIAQPAEMQLRVPIDEGGCRLSRVDWHQNVYVEELNESGCELRLPTGDDWVESAAPETGVRFSCSAERVDVWFVHDPSDADGTVIEPDAWRVAHASKVRGLRP